MKLYTKKGDRGQTELYGGRKIDKDDPRIDAIGTVDELNAALGVAASDCGRPQIGQVLKRTQGRLFELGWDLSKPRSADAGRGDENSVRITGEHVAEAEHDIDRACADLPEMRTFILPGGTELAARLHLARAVCRRAERLCVALGREETLGEHLPIYLNRLSDLLFALARQANHLAAVEDVAWTRGSIC